jgi:hypothetical protein
MFGLGIDMGWFYKSPSLGLEKKGLKMGIELHKKK